jgi:N-acetylglucosamine malate deacetylase 1
MLDLTQFERVLAFFAHPDDETLAAGATIHRLSAIGSTVHVAIPSTGIFSRRNMQSASECAASLDGLRQDCERAISVLGVNASNIFLGEFSDNEMDRHTLLELIQWLEKIIDIVKPNLLITHHRFCTNIDHQYCHEAAIVATRPDLNKHITVWCGEVPSSTGYLRPVQWEPNLFVEISRQDLESKITAMETYRGEARPDPHPRSREVIAALAKVRGSEAGFYFAEAFMVSKCFA